MPVVLFFIHVGGLGLAIVKIKELLEGGIHFGHKASKWHPAMEKFIHGKKNKIHIINLKHTIKGIITAHHFLKSVVADGQEVLFVGTKRQAREIIRREAQRCKMPYVADRWIGGTFTNFDVIRTRVGKLVELEQLQESEEWGHYSKKMISSLTREKRKIDRNLGGIRDMKKLPGALFIVDPKEEHIAVCEARKARIPIVGLLDTDSNPADVDIPIPGNDDAIRSIDLVCKKMADAVAEGLKSLEMKGVFKDDSASAAPKATKAAPEKTEGNKETENAPEVVVKSD